MSSINNISGLSNTSYLQQTSAALSQVGMTDSDGDSDGSSGVRKAGKSNFLSAIEQALGQSLPSSSTTSSAGSSTSNATPSTSDPQAALQAFMQNLFAALGQINGGQGSGSDSDGDNDGSKAVSGTGKHGSQLAAKLQTLLQQLSANNQTTSAGTQGSGTDPLSNLNASFQNLIDSMNAAQGQNATAGNTPTLQSFLQNLMQDIGNGNISGAVVSTQA